MPRREEDEESRREEFAKLKEQEPKEGDVLSTPNDKYMRLHIRTKREDGQFKKVVFCRAAVDVSRKGWFLTEKEFGIVCMILPDSQKNLQGDEDGNLLVKSIRVVRYSKNGQALLCEVLA